MATTPVIKAPVDSIRWEMIREGLEDREYFWLLKQELARVQALNRQNLQPVIVPAQKMLISPDEIITSLTEYDRDPQQLYRLRTDLARTIEKLQQIK